MQTMTCNNFTFFFFFSKFKLNFRFKTVQMCKEKTFKGKNNTSVSFNAISTPYLMHPQNPSLFYIVCKILLCVYCPQRASAK